MKFRSVSTHPEDLADGRVVAPGEFVEMTREQTEDPHNELLIAEGRFIGTTPTGRNIVEEAELPDEGQEGGSK